MTFVVVATEPGDPAELPYGDEVTLLERLLAQLDAFKVADVRVIARPESAELLRKNGHDVVESADLAGDLRLIAGLARTTAELYLAYGDLVLSDELLDRLLRDRATTAITARQPVTGTRPAVRISKRVIVSAGSRFHQVTDPDAVFRGALKVLDTATLATAAEELAATALADVEPVRVLGRTEETLDVFVDNDARDEFDRRVSEHAVLGSTAPAGDDAVALCLVALTRSGVRVAARNVDVLVCERALTADQAVAARAAIEAIDEDKVRLDAAVKSNDGFFTTYFVSSYSQHIARWCARRGLTPNAVTCISMGLAVIASLWFAEGTRAGLVTGAVFLYVAFVFDCVDGQVARYTRQYSVLGAWLDATFDR
ncbi:MAG: CDP-alcohol phosphatidyltransferase family protein, partial [Streptosporangiaceae bacterium]